MNYKIYYFSGTGNTFWSARRLAELLGGCELHNIASVMKRETISLSAPNIIIMFPAYAYEAPLMVRRFVKRAEIHAEYIAAVVTFGSSQGGALAEITRLLKRKKLALSYAGRIPCVENYIPIFGPPTEKKAAERLSMQEAATEKVSVDIKAGLQNKVVKFRPACKTVSTFFRGAKPLFVKTYRVTKACTGCGLCARLCPAGAIEMRADADTKKPYFLCTVCEHCQACLNWCPQKAINYVRMRKNTPRYHHPDVKASDLFMIDKKENSSE
ncbi:MAG: EFR1 family ferrodoxin [Clostridiales bacterium]|jgi:formate hydrogenlyase subunit 6/NADH:ubiquinone oxidoreductase subunit I|nr:EFR1 family ferrodoxin [Clostridiales bacterium]